MPINPLDNEKENLMRLIEKSEESRLQGYLNYTTSSHIIPSIREELLHWLIDLAPDLKFSISVAVVAFGYIDRFLSAKPNACLSVLGLLAITALSLALKFYESRRLSPQEIMEMLDGRYSIETITTMEIYVLKVLDWKLDVDTPCVIIDQLVEFTLDSNSKVKEFAYSYAALCYMNTYVCTAGNYNLAIASILMALDRLGFSQVKNGWLEVVEGIRLDRDKVQFVEKGLNCIREVGKQCE